MPSPYFFKANESEGRIFRVGLVHYREPNKRMDERIMMFTKVLKFADNGVCIEIIENLKKFRNYC